MTPDQLRRALAFSIEPGAFRPLTMTFGYPDQVAQQRRRQERALKRADLEIQMVQDFSLLASFPASARNILGQCWLRLEEMKEAIAAKRVQPEISKQSQAGTEVRK